MNKSLSLMYKIPRDKEKSIKPLQINDFSGYNQPYHPSVIYFNDDLFGYKYWMAQTPYPINGTPYRDRWESPCVYWSNDGINWITNKNNNPIDDLKNSEIRNSDYFSDPHLVYRDDTKELECWYRITHKDKKMPYPTSLLRKTSNDGLNWSERELLIDFQSTESLDNMVRSPSILWDSKKKKYRMWYVDTLAMFDNKNIIYAESKNGKKWENKNTIKLNKYIDPWHIDVNYFDEKYHLINYTLTGNKGINYYESNDGVNFKYIKELLKPAKFQKNSFYRAGLYRSCSIKVNDKIRVYFSASDGISTHIGVMEGENFENLQVVNIAED